MNTRIMGPVLAAIALTLTAPLAQAGLLDGLRAEAKASSYIVQLRPEALGAGVVSDIATRLLGVIGAGAPTQEYTQIFPGFAVSLTEKQARLLKALPEVLAIEPDQLVSGSATQASPTYGLDRVDEFNLPLDGELLYPDSAGAGVHVYVLDSGINPQHSEFIGRVGTSRNFVNDGPVGTNALLVLNLEPVWSALGYAADPDNWEDCNGHGTHVAGTAVGTQYGLAKRATVHAVRVLGCSNLGALSGMLAGVDWVLANAEYPAVANLSLGAANSDFLDQGIAALFEANILPVVAAMNDDADACSGSPSGAPEAVTVGATDASDNESTFSNHGTCVDIFAPGTDITSAGYTDATGTAVMSGTSMASPHVAGAAALLLGETPSLTAADVAAALIAQATPGVIALSPADAGSPNLLLNVAPQAVKK